MTTDNTDREELEPSWRSDKAYEAICEAAKRIANHYCSEDDTYSVEVRRLTVAIIEVVDRAAVAAPQPYSLDPIGDFVDKVWALANDRYGWAKITLRGLAEGLARQYAATPATATAAEHERCHVSVTGRHRIDPPFCKDCGQTFVAGTVAATSGPREVALRSLNSIEHFARALLQQRDPNATATGIRMIADAILSNVTALRNGYFPSAVPVEPHCWHCGTVLESTELKLRCDQCPADCDDESCNAYGCAPCSG